MRMNLQFMNAREIKLNLNSKFEKIFYKTFSLGKKYLILDMFKP